MLCVCCELFADFIGLCINWLISCVRFSNNNIEIGAITITLAMLILSAPSDSLYILVYFNVFKKHKCLPFMIIYLHLTTIFWILDTSF